MNKIDIIHCPTKNLCRTVGQRIGNSLWVNWENYKENMCLVKGVHEYSGIDFFLKNLEKYNIIKGDDFLNQEIINNYQIY